MRKINVIVFLLMLWLVSFAHDWTYKVTTTDVKDFYMWTPYVKNIRGILFSTKPGYIAGLLGDTAIRRVCKEEQIAIVAYNANDLNPANVWPILQNGLKALAIQSGFPEVEFAPVCTHGHSTEGLAAVRLASFKPERCFGVIMQNSIINNDDSTSLNTRIGNVPLLSIRGSEERRISQVSDYPWSATRKAILWMRRSNEKANLIIQPGAGHFGWFPFTSQYVSKWLKQVARTMIPIGELATSSTITLNTINQNQGWLTECPDTLNAATLNAITPLNYNDYVSAEKDPKRALWHFSQELAQYWIDAHKAEENKLSVQLRFANSSYAVDNAWANRINYSSFTQTVNLSANSIPANLTLRYATAWNVLDVANTVFTPNACRYVFYGNTDWGLALFDGDNQYRVSEQAQWLRVNVNRTDAEFLYADISNKQSNDAPFAMGATYNSNIAKPYVVAGAIRPNGSNLEIDPFSKGTSTAELCYCYNQYRSNPTDKFYITYINGTWSDPTDYVTHIKPDLSIEFNAISVNEKLILRFISTNTKNVRIKLYDITGKIVFSSNNQILSKESNQVVLDLPQLSGIYVLTCDLGGKRYVKRISI